MAAASPASVHTQIAAGKTGPLYLILGEDEEEKARFVSRFAEVVEEELRPFNVERLYGGEATLDDVMASARTLPMLAPKRVVTVLRAERLLMPKRESLQATRDLDAFEAFIKAPEAHATVVLVASGLDRRRAIVKTLFKRATVIDFGGLADTGDAQRWVRTEQKRRGVTIEPDAISSVGGPGGDGHLQAARGLRTGRALRDGAVDRLPQRCGSGGGPGRVTG